MKKIHVAALLLGLATICAGNLALAASGDIQERGARQMQMSPEQIEAQKLFKEQYQSTAPLRKQLELKRAELKVLSLGANPDESKVRNIFQEMADIKTKLFMSKCQFRAEMEKKGLDNFGKGPRHHGDRHPHGGHGGHGPHNFQ